jgi:glycosyltransferase involved in cell wall biosynthesis
MKILQVINFFSPVHGGSAEVPYKLSKELVKRGHGVTIYTSDYKLSKEWGKSAQELQINVSPFRTWLNCASLLVTPGIFKRARKEVEHFDVVHMHNYRTFQNIVIHNYTKKYGTGSRLTDDLFP